MALERAEPRSVPLGTMNGPRTPGSWRFRPQSSREVRRDDGAAQRDRLGAALRAGHGTGASFGFSLSSGPEPTLRLLSRDPTSVRWAARVFTTAYERPQWSWTLEGDPSGDLSGVWHGDRARPWPNPLRSAADGVPMIDAVVLVFSALPPGARCVWWVRPLTLTHPRWWDIDPPAPVPPPRRPGPDSPQWRARPEPPEEGRDRPLFWDVRVLIGSDREVGGVALASRSARALESATRTVRGNGLRFHRRHWWTGDQGAGFVVAESELTWVLPSPACPATGAAFRPSTARLDLLPLGRTAAGTVIGPRIEPGQGRHLAVLGETGMGKSSLLIAVGRRVVEESGLILFDPLGDTTRALREELSAATKARMTWIQSGAAVGLNALEGIGGRPGTARPVGSASSMTSCTRCAEFVPDGTRTRDSGARDWRRC